MKGFILYNGARDNAELNLLLEEAKKQSIELTLIDPKKIVVNMGNTTSKLFVDGKEEEYPDFVISAFSNGYTYFNIALMQQFESMGVLCINKPRVLEITQDKLLTTQKLIEVGIPVAKTMLVSSATSLELIEKEFTYPIVIKPLKGQKGGGIFLVHNKTEMKNILELRKATGLGDEIIIQEMIQESKGHDIRVVIFGHKAVGCALREAVSADEFRSNHSIGGNISFHELTPQIKEISERVAKKLDLFMAGIDLLIGKDGYIICEANSLPGFYFPNQENPWGIDVPKEFFKSIKNALSK